MAGNIDHCVYCTCFLSDEKIICAECPTSDKVVICLKVGL